MSLFDHTSYLRVLGALHLNSFTIYHATNSPADDSPDGLPMLTPQQALDAVAAPAVPIATALFGLPSFMNHSCLPNVHVRDKTTRF